LICEKYACAEHTEEEVSGVSNAANAERGRAAGHGERRTVASVAIARAPLLPLKQKNNSW
jgi:hypothetical protein